MGVTDLHFIGAYAAADYLEYERFQLIDAIASLFINERTRR